MLSKLGEFLRPRIPIVTFFLILVFTIQVPFVYFEPTRAWYPPDIDPQWEMKPALYPSIVREYLFHTDGDIDVLFGIIGRDYFTNAIGIPLLTIYYFAASGIHWIGRRFVN